MTTGKTKKPYSVKNSEIEIKSGLVELEFAFSGDEAKEFFTKPIDFNSLKEEIFGMIGK